MKSPLQIFSFCLVGISLLGLSASQAQTNDKNSVFWESVSEATLNSPSIRAMGQGLQAPGTTVAVRASLPRKYRTLLLKRDAMEAVLRKAPREFTKTMEEANIQIELPLPDGGFARFHVLESPILPPNLAKKYPSIRTYVLQGIDDPTATGRVDLSSRGFRALVLTEQGSGSFAIDPYWQNNPQGIVSYYFKDSGIRAAECRTAPPTSRQAQQIKKSLSASNTTSAIGDNAGSTWGGGSVRVIRLAVACSGEFSQQITGTSGNTPGNLPITLEFIAGLANRVSAILHRDFGLRFQLVEGQESIIFLNPATDPYPALINNNGNTAALAQANQATVDQRIGAANYEFGHLLVGDSVSWGESTGSIYGSVFGILGDDSRKAMCISSRGSTDFNRYNFDLLVAHEMGHGLNANHTFSDRYEGTGAQVEPGSGSTIMSYAGITAIGNLQADSDGYYSSKSLEQMITYASSTPGNAAYEIISNGNLPPVLSRLTNYTIPAQTPFVLTASATDDNADPLTYCWEQQDSALKAKNPVATPRDDGSSPLFRSLPSSTNPSRIFPQLKYILNNKNVPPPGDGSSGSTNYATGEFLPTTSRAMKFRVTVRDNYSGGGALAFATCVVQSIAGAGPFAVTNFNTSSELVSGAQQSLGWSVNFTGPGTVINCANVRITLSTDGGNTFTNIIAASAPNNGRYEFIVPDIATTQARFKVEAIGNIFFDISDVNISIRPPFVANDLFARPRVIGPSLPISTSGSTAGATAEGVEPSHSSGLATSSVWFQWTAPANGRVTFSTAGSSFDTVLAVYTGSSLRNLSKIAANNDAAFNDKTSRLQFLAAAGQTYYLALDGLRGESGNYFLSATGALLARPGNDNILSRSNLGSSSTFLVNNSVLEATAETGEPPLAGTPPTRSVWYSWTAPSSGSLSLDSGGSDFGNVLGIYTGSSFTNLKLLQGQASPAFATNRIIIPVTVGSNYIIKVDGAKSANGSHRLSGQLTTLAAPTTLAFTNFSTSNRQVPPRIGWSAVAGASHYQVEIWRSNLLVRGISVQSPATSWNNGPALVRTNGYTARICAFSNNLASDWTTAPAVFP